MRHAHIRPALLAAALTLPLALTACGDDEPSTPAVETSTGVNAVTPEPAAGPPSVSDLMAAAGCDGGPIEPQLYTTETGRCLIGGEEVDVATFTTSDARDSWTEAANAVGAIAKPGGDLWAASSVGAAGVDAFLAAAGS